MSKTTVSYNVRTRGYLTINHLLIYIKVIPKNTKETQKGKKMMENGKMFYKIHLHGSFFVFFFVVVVVVVF